MNLTYNIELEAKSQEHNALLIQMLVQYTEMVNSISEYVFEKRKSRLNLKEIHDDNYYKMRELYPNLPSQLIIKALREVVASYKAIKSNKHKLNSPVNKTNLSLRLDKRLYSKFTKIGISISIPGKTNKRAEFEFKLYPKAKDMLDRYMPADPLIFVRDNKTMISAGFTVPEQLPSDDSKLGVDLGMRRLFVTSDGKALKADEYLKHKRRIRYQKRMLQSKGTRSTKRKIKKLRRKEANFSKNYTHHVANEILKTDKSIIVMEDLSKIKTKKNKYQNLNAKSQIPFYMLLHILTYKAPLKGKRVETVNPAYTSQDDSRGLLERGNRQGCRYYAKDGKVLDADWNASVNIANRIGDHPISSNTPDGGLTFVGRLLSISQSSETSPASPCPSGRGY